MSESRYEHMQYRRCGRSGLKLPPVSLGLWHNLGAERRSSERAILRRAFDLGVTHFDLANNYGTPYGSAESNFGRLLARGFPAVSRRADHLDKGGLGHVAGAVRRAGLAQVRARESRPEPAAHGAGLRRHLLLASLRSRHAAGRDAGRARTAVQQGKALYVGHLRLLARARRARPPRCCALELPLLIHQPKYSCSSARSRTGCSRRWRARHGHASPFRRWRTACLSSRYLDGMPAGSRAASGARASDARTRHAGCAGQGRALERDRARPRPDTRAARDRVGRCAIRA